MDEQAVAVVESTSNYWYRTHDVLEENGINTLLANPLKTRIIAQARLKDDKLDSNVLADLLRAELVYESFVPDKEHRELRHLVRSRISLVQERSAFKNKVRSILDKYEFTRYEYEPFSKRGINWLKSVDFLSWSDKLAMDSNVAIIELLDMQIEVFTKKIASIVVGDDKTKLLMTVPGIDYVTALTIIAEIVDVKRFSTPWKLVSYAGLAPSRRESGQQTSSIGMRITKQGSKTLRYAMVEAANTALRDDERLGKFYRRIAERRGPQKARVATAKEMLVIIWHILTNNEPYRTMNKEMIQKKYKRLAWKAS
jgi:transposase